MEVEIKLNGADALLALLKEQRALVIRMIENVREIESEIGKQDFGLKK